MGLLFFFLFSTVHCFQFRSPPRYGPRVRDPEAEWRRLEAEIDLDLGPRSGTAKPKTTAASFPEYLRQPMNKYNHQAFQPTKGTRNLPDWAKDILLVPSKTELNSWPGQETAMATGRATRPMLIEMLCHIDRIYVRIRRVLFKTKFAYKGLKFGKCPVNQGTKEHYYFLYYLKTDCGQSFESQPDYMAINSVLQYDPEGVALREGPINVPLQCKYHRLFHAYKVGFYPKVQGAVIFKPLSQIQIAVLVAVDESGNEITGDKTYTLGQVMYFVAKNANDTGSSEDQRMYINRCYVTAGRSPNTNTNQNIIDNQGCMVDSKVSEKSKFLIGPSKMVLKFSVGAFVFKGADSSPQQLHMHCEVSVGNRDPSPSAKACNYDPVTKKWKELYGDGRYDSVCDCCDTTCPRAQPRASRKISSPSWQVELDTLYGYAQAEPMTFNNVEAEGRNRNDDWVNYWEHEY